MQIELAVSEADIGNVLEQQRVEFTVDAFPNRKFEGRVRQVRFAPTTNQNVVTYTTVVAVNNKDLRLRPGMTATATLITLEKTNVVRIPASAIRFSPPAGSLFYRPPTRSPPTTSFGPPALRVWKVYRRLLGRLKDGGRPMRNVKIRRVPHGRPESGLSGRPGAHAGHDGLRRRRRWNGWRPRWWRWNGRRLPTSAARRRTHIKNCVCHQASRSGDAR